MANNPFSPVNATIVIPAKISKIISEIERGSSICSLATITNIAITLNTRLDYLVLGITEINADQSFTEILQSIPSKNQKLYIDLCENIANTLK